MLGNPEDKGRCRYCERMRMVRSASRYGAGAYNRAGRWYQSRICEECATGLVERATPGHTTASNWNIGSLERAWGLTRAR